MKLADKVAVITGAGSGIGRTSARLFAGEGAKVIIADIDDAGGKETLAMIKADGGEALFIFTDVTDASSTANIIRETVTAFGKIDILFNNAGIMPGLLAIEDIDEAVWDRVFAVNVKGMFLMTKNAVPEMKKTGQGVIINTASTHGFRPKEYRSVYSSTKGAIITLTKALALELAPANIRVNWIAPGVTQTPILVLPEDKIRAIIKTVPLGRMSQPEDIAKAALFLASEESAMVTGTGITVDGGQTC